MRTALLPALLVVAMLAGCGGDPAPTAPPPAAAEPEKLKPALAADAVGYDGAALQRSVDRLQQQQAEQEKAIDEAGREAGR